MSFGDHDPYDHLELRIYSRTTDIGMHQATWECESCGGEGKVLLGVLEDGALDNLLQDWRKHLEISHPHIKPRCAFTWHGIQCSLEPHSSGHHDIHAVVTQDTPAT